MHFAGEVTFVVLAYFAWRWGWRSGAPKEPKEPKRPGFIERRPDVHGRRYWGPEPRRRDVRRAYMAVRRARGLSGQGWWPRHFR